MDFSKNDRDSAAAQELSLAEQAFLERGIDWEIADRLGARYVQGAKGPRFEFDYRSQGELKFKKLRSPDKQFFLDRKGVKLQLWNIDGLRDLPSPVAAPLVITEGEFDAIAVVQACGGHVTSVPNGVAGDRTKQTILIAEDNRFAYLWGNERLIPEIDQFDKIILATDADEPGMILRDELALRIGETRCWFVVYPEDCKDANDVLLKHGAVALRRLIGEAMPMRPGFLIRPSEVPSKRYERTYSTGWPSLDVDLRRAKAPSLMLIRPELVVVTGEPGHGKGQWVRALVCRMAKHNGMRTAFFAPEDPPHRIRRDLLRFAQKPYLRLYSGEPVWEMDDKQDAESKQWVDDHFRISTPPEDEPVTLDMVEKEMESAALHHDCQIFVLDPWNEVEHAIGNGETETQYIERSLRRLRRKMRRLGLILILVAHPTKLTTGDPATLYNISGSANWRNKADHGIIIYRHSDDDTGELTAVTDMILEKAKDHETMGLPGKCSMAFDRYSADYTIGIPNSS
jgi:twinkle protein